MPISSSNEYTTSRDWTNKCRRTNYSRKAVFVFVIFVMGFMFSCIPYKNIDFQIMRPAQIKLGNNIEKVDIHCEFCYDSSQIIFLDSINQNYARVSLNFIYTLKENLQKSPLFKNTQFSIISSDSLLFLIKDYKTRVRENGLVIILDSIYLKDTILVQKVKYSNYNSYTYVMAHKFGCRTHDIRTMQIVNNYLLQDTVFWPSQFSEWDILSSVPSFSEAIWDTGIKAGEKYAHFLAPYWVDQSRIFLYGHKAFISAYNLIQHNELDSALDVLQKENKKKIGKGRTIKTLFNEAVIYELKDDLSNALIMADSSFNLGKKDYAKEYAAKLRLRKLDKVALDWQLN